MQLSRSSVGPIFSSLILLLTLGCGTESKEPGGAGSTGSPPPAQTDGAVDFSTVTFTSSLPDKTTLLSGGQDVGTPECAVCHATPGSPLQVMKTGKSFDKVAGNVSWLFGPHGNYESLNPATFQLEDHGVDNTGFPYYGFEGFGTDPKCTTNCHDPLGEGLKIAGTYAATGNDKIGRVNRPIIGCESCHGGGKTHYGVASLPVARPNAVRCGRCHNDSIPDDHLKFQPEGDKIFEDYRSSAHAGSINSHTYVMGSTTSVRALCSRCHTDEGAQLYVPSANGTESYADLVSKMSGKADIANAAVVQCRTCHDKHNSNTLLGSKAVYTAGSAAATTWSDEFKTCTVCHQLLREDGARNAAAYHDPAVNTRGNTNEIITDTHFDDPGTGDIEGYIINPSGTHNGKSGNTNSGACSDCHNPHDADNTINNEWANSAHGGFIATVKDAGGNGAVKDSTAPAWVHFDFKLSNRLACQRCHTATGFRNLANNPTGYNPASNVFVASGSQKEMLYCWACHSSNKGNLRNPGRLVLESSYVIPPGRSIPTNLSGSFICMNCHSGRETAQYIKSSYTDATIIGKNFGTFNSHYLAAGGILFRTIGYEYSGRDYSNSDKFEHDLIGVVIDGTGTDGPCVGCHMRSTEGHRFEAVKKDQNGVITDIPAMATVCSKCHGVITDNVSASSMNNLDSAYNSAMAVLKDLLAKKGIYYNKASHPYFFNTSDPSQQTSANGFINWPNMDTLGAAFNLNLFANQPGAFAHNSLYTKRLLYDPIDLLDDGAMNNSVKATLNALPNDNPNKQGAIQFLLSSTGGRP